MAAHPAAGYGAFKYRIDFNPAGLSGRADAAVRAAIVTIGNEVKQRSNAIAPRRDGGLIGSSRADPEGHRVEVSYNIIYAHYQHEGTGFRHPNGGQAKYLSQVMEDPAIMQLMRDTFIQQLGLK